jgi:hypothetical protein
MINYILENHEHNLYPIIIHIKGMTKAVTAKYIMTSIKLDTISPMIRYTHLPVMNLL